MIPSYTWGHSPVHSKIHEYTQRHPSIHRETKHFMQTITLFTLKGLMQQRQYERNPEQEKIERRRLVRIQNINEASI